MADRPNNGLRTPKRPGRGRDRPRIALLACLVVAPVAACGLDLGPVSSTLLPFLAVAAAHFWQTAAFKGSLSSEMSHGLFCASVLGEILGWSTPLGFAARTAIHVMLLILTGLVVGQEEVLLTYVFSRLFLWTCLSWVPEILRSILCYASSVGGHLAAKYLESVFVTRLLSEIKFSAPRRRRPSNNSLYTLYKVRRTSLPALGGSNKSVHHSFGFQGASSTVDVALLAEAHGLVTDMLADPNLPAHVVGGLRSLASLLAPPSQVALSHRVRPGGASVSLADFNSGSDNEEIPYTGEKPSALSKRFRRNLPPSLLRRMSTSTWTTTTSATGLPTLEPEPSRKRSTSFRHPTDSSSPQGAGSPQGHCALSPSRSQLSSPVTSCSKGRSYSTTSIPSGGPSLSRRNSRDRKTVCSLHPLTSAEIEALHRAHHAASRDDLQIRMMGRSDDNAETTEDDDEGGQPLPPLPCIRRVNVTSDYESSNESPGSSDNNDAAPLSSVDSLTKSLAMQTQDLNRCTLCGGRTRHGVSVEGGTRSPVSCDNVTPTNVVEEEDDSPGMLVGGYRYCLETLDADPLLNRISEWDYPIFELKEQAKDLILSQICYKVFHEVGLFDAFKIPIQEFLNYFHALECGYREKPYHNRMHAADVLQGVYYLTSQPIPGFTQIPSDVTDSPLHKTPADGGDGGCSGSATVHRASFAADATYGVMGANYPALELMALYSAAAMHDYDHPGRTNAFLVSTYAPQAVLYNDRSVLENHHAAAAWSLFLSRPEYNFLCHLDKAEFKRFRFLVIECILATDLKRHFEILAEFNAKANEDDAPGIDWMSETDRLLAMEMCIKLADINGPCKRHDIHFQWTQRIAEEFYEQGDEEANLGLQVSPFMDRKNPQLAKLQESFINHLVAPLCNAYGEAALLPGVWVEDSESGDDEDTPDTSESTPTVKFADDTRTDSEASTAVQRPMKNRKVSCLQTNHIRENYDYWVEILKREQMENERAEAKRKEAEELESEAQDAEEEMETIEEECTIQRLSPTEADNC